MDKEENDAENLIDTSTGQRMFNGVRLANSEMLWKCSTEGCSSEPKIRLRSTYSKRFYCNTCSNRIKCSNPDFLAKRGKSISKAISELGDKWSVVSKANNSKQETKDKISSSMKMFISQNPEGSLKIRSETAIKNNKITGFGSSDFSKKVWSGSSPEDRLSRTSRSTENYKIFAKNEHFNLVNLRYPDFKIVEYTGYLNTYKCSKLHVFHMIGSNFLKRGVCPECTPRSNVELDLFTWYRSVSPAAEPSRRVLYLDDTKSGNRALEIDVYDSSRRFGIEVHGLYYHRFVEGDVKRDRDYHKTKTELAIKNDINLLQFFEDEVNEKNDIVKSIILSKIGKSARVIQARKTTIKEVNKEDSIAFADSNHLQGSCRSSYNYGLYLGEELVSLITLRKKEDQIVEIARFCNKLNTTVTGGFAKLMKLVKLTMTNEGFTKMISYSDRRYSDGAVYSKNNFAFVHHTDSDMFWVKGSVRFARQISWGKKDQEMYNDKYYKIFGSGHSLWSLPLIQPNP